MNRKLKIAIVDLIFISFVTIIIVGSAIYAFAQKNDINEYENRPANKFESPSFASINNQKFQNGMEDAFADQLPFSLKIKKEYNKFTKQSMMHLNSFILPKKDSTNETLSYVPYSGLQMVGDHIVYGTRNLDQEAPRLDPRIKNINAVVNANPSLDFYLYYIEKDTDINFETNEKNGVYEYLNSNIELPNNHKSRFEINSYADYSKNFFMTDHHWNYQGSYKGYTEIMSMIYPKDLSLLQPTSEYCRADSYSGSKGISTATQDIFKETFCINLFNYPEHEILVNNQPYELSQFDEFINNPDFKPAYGSVYGNDLPIIHFNFYDSSKENLLIFGESFDNPIIEPIASHFNNTYSVDLRNFEDESFEFDQFVRENAIDKVIFVGNLDFYVSDKFNIGGY